MAPRTRLQVIQPFTTHVFNRLSRLVAGWLPGFGLLLYRGRKTGKAYRTPMNVFHRGDDVVFALTYSSEAQWVQNVLAAGECGLRTMGRDYRLTEPRLYVDPSRVDMPVLIEPFLALMDVTEFLRMRIEPASRPSPRTRRDRT